MIKTDRESLNGNEEATRVAYNFIRSLLHDLPDYPAVAAWQNTTSGRPMSGTPQPVKWLEAAVRSRRWSVPSTAHGKGSLFGPLRRRSGPEFIDSGHACLCLFKN